MKKHVLNDDFDLNCKVFGLVSTEPFMEIAWRLKKGLLIPFERVEDIEWNNDQVKYFAPNYQYFDPMTETRYALIRNKADSGWVASEYKAVDVFLMETNYSKTFVLKPGEVSKSKYVQYCFEIEVETLSKVAQQRLDIN